MKKVILYSLITISVAFGVDCNAMIKRYTDEPEKLFYNCIDNNNADACFCFSGLVGKISELSLKSGNYNEANKYLKFAMEIMDDACQLGSREACNFLDKVKGARK